jgi:hypothetical protein
LTLQPSEAHIVEEARDLLQLIPPHNSIPKKFSVAARHHVVKEDFSGHGSAFHVMGAPRILEIVRGNFNPPVFHCFPAELAAIVREPLQLFSEAGPCGGGALLCNIFILPFSMNGAAGGTRFLSQRRMGSLEI